MLKRFFSFFMFVFFSIFYVFLTSFFVKYIKSLDPIMICIEKNRSNYEEDAEDAIIDDVFVIPGKKGVKVDVDSSYQLMKKYGNYDEKLLVFDEVIPNVSISNIYDKYLSGGNPNNKDVSFVFKIEDNKYLKEIVSILKKKNIIATFFVTDGVLKKDEDIIKFLYLNNQQIESLGNNGYSFLELDTINNYISNYTLKKISYCYSDSYNEETLKVCSKKKMHTIIPSINTLKRPYYEIKENLSNGKIIKFDNNKRVVCELNFIINYIRQNNYEIISLKKLLEE